MTIPAQAYFQIKATADRGELDGQEKKPSYWITTTYGGAGYFAVMIWDGMGFEEPWQSGDGRYRTDAEAQREAREWAEAEELEFRP